MSYLKKEAFFLSEKRRTVAVIMALMSIALSWSSLYAQDLCLHKTATASSVQDGTFPASNAVDGNIITRWSSLSNDPQWIQVDLGSKQPIAMVNLDWETGSAQNYTIDVSDNGTTWTTIAAKTNMAPGPRTDKLSGLSGSGRYIRMNGTARNTQYGYSLYSFSAFANYDTSRIKVQTGATAQLLLNAILGEQLPNGVTIQSVKYVGSDTASGLYSKMPPIQGINVKDGIILTNGSANGVTISNDSIPVMSHNLGLSGDSALLALANMGQPDSLRSDSSFDASILAIEFTTDTTINGISFDFIFGSEEYPAYVGSIYNDIFCAFLDGKNISFDSNKKMISVNNNYFTIDNLSNQYNIACNGLTPLLRSSEKLKSGKHILKFAIADMGDHILDSYIFLSNLKFQLSDTGTSIVSVISDQTFTIKEDAASGSFVGKIHVMVADSSNVTFSLLTSSPQFVLNQTTGILTVANGMVFNASVTNSYSFPVKTVYNGTFDTATITIKILPATTPANASLTPATVVASLDIGQTLKEHKTLHLPADVSNRKADIIFAVDVSQGMYTEVAQLKSNAVAMMNKIRAIIPDTRFGVLSNTDYNITTEGMSNICDGYQARYGGLNDYPYKCNRTLTDRINDVSDAINALPNINSDGDLNTNSYTRVLYESYSDTSIGWRSGAKRLILYWIYGRPHDCTRDFVYGVYGKDNGPDPGRDGIVGTDDDLNLESVLTSMAQKNITLVALCSQNTYYDNGASWGNFAHYTGGESFSLYPDGTPIFGPDLATYVTNLIQAQLKHIDTLTLKVTTPGYENWLLSSDPAFYTNITLDSAKDLTFDIALKAPASTVPGTYNFKVSAIGDGVNYASQDVSITIGKTAFGTVSVSAGTSSIPENGGVGNFVLSRNDTTKPCTVYFTLSGTATNGTDYTNVPDSVVLQSGQKTANIAIAAIKDSVIEGNETVILSIDSSRAGHTLNYIRGTPASATITITDFVTAVTVTASVTAIPENGGTGRFIISRSDTAGACTVYFTVSGTATTGTDFTYAPADSVVMQNGHDSAFVTVSAIPDKVLESTETVILTIDSMRAGRTLKYVPGTPFAATMKIDDYTNVVTVTVSASSISENNGTAKFVITRSDINDAETVYFELRGSAAYKLDYTADHSDSIVFGKSQSTAAIVINALSDTLTEEDRTVICVLDSSRSGRVITYSVGIPDTAAINIKNSIEPYTLEPHAINNPYFFGNSPVPDAVLGLPGINTNQLASANGRPQGLLLVLAISSRAKGPVSLSGTVSIYDVVSNSVAKDLPMVYDPQTKRLYAVWNGRNGDGRNASLGTYLAVFEVSDNFQNKATQKIRIGVKQ